VEYVFYVALSPLIALVEPYEDDCVSHALPHYFSNTSIHVMLEKHL